MTNVSMCGCSKNESLNTEEHDENWLLDATHDLLIEIHFLRACMIQERKIQRRIRIDFPTTK